MPQTFACSEILSEGDASQLFGNNNKQHIKA